MYNNGNSSKNVTGSSVVDGTMESADYADNGLSGDKIDGGIISNFQSTGIDDRSSTAKNITLTDSNTTFSGDIKVDNGAVSSVVSTGTAAGVVQISGGGTVIGTSSFDLIQNGVGSHVWARNSEPLMFATGGTERMRILSTGGLTFNGDTAAANALDDYEEGTWEPVVKDSSNNACVMTSPNGGYYTKVGNLVTVTAVVQISSTSGVTTSDGAKITGLPYNTNSTRMKAGVGAVRIQRSSYNNDYVVARTHENSDYILLEDQDSNTAVYEDNITIAELSAHTSTDATISLTYII